MVRRSCNGWRAARLPPGEALDLARQLCSGLAEAHRCGVLHCDLKPANVVLCCHPGQRDAGGDYRFWPGR